MAHSNSDFEYAYGVLKLNLKYSYDIEVKEFCPSGDETLHGFSDDRVADFDPVPCDGKGRSIKLRQDIPAEFKVFSVLHLFGHIIQFNESPEDKKTSLTPVIPGQVSETALAGLHDYEQRASRYGVALLKKSGLNMFVPWYSDITAADWKFLQDVYRGHKPNVPDKYVDIAKLLTSRKEEYYVEGQEVLKPLRPPNILLERTFSQGKQVHFRIL